MTFTTTAISLLSESTKAILEKANYAKPRTNIPNTHKAVFGDAGRLESIAEALGINFSLTEYTFTVANGVKGKAVYSPYVGNYKGDAAIFWGNVRKPLSEVTCPMVVEEAGKRFVLEIEIGDDILQLSLMLPKDSPTDKRTLNRALKAGKLAELLAKSFEKPKSLSELESGEYKVTEYKVTDFNGDIKYTIFIEGQGWFNTNTRLRRKLVSLPVINSQLPAKLVVEKSTETTSTGYPIVPCELTTVADQEIEVFDFD